MADNVPITPGTGTLIATDEVGGVHYQKVKLAFGAADAATLVSATDKLPVDVGTVAVTGSFYQATQPISGTVSVSGSVAVTGTFFQATQPVSGTITANAGTGTFAISAASLPLPSGAATSAKQPALGTAGAASTDVITVQGIASGTAQPVSGTVTANAGSGTFAVSGTFWQATQPVSISGNQAVNNAQINGVTPLMGNGVTGTGSQRVTIASDNTAFSVNATLQAGTAAIGKLAANTGVTIGAVEIASAQTLATVTNLAQLGGAAIAMGTGARSAGTQRVTIATDDLVPVSPPTITKATQASTGFSTQDLKDAGRAIVNAATAIAGVTAVTSEALLSLNVSRDGAATSGITTITVTSGKRFRVQAIVASVRSTSAAVLSGRVSLRMNPSGAVTASSPIIAILSMTQQAAALAEAGDTCVLSIPDGLEFSGTEQIGLTQVCSGTAGVVYASIVGFEY